MRRKKKEAEEAKEIDLTPMLDVVFIMLIFFIVTASFIKEAGVEVDRPPSVTWEPKKNANILIAIDANNDIWMDKKMINPRSVRANIERMHAENPKGAVVIQADKKSTAEKFALVMDAAKEAGVIDVSLSTEKN